MRSLIKIGAGMMLLAVVLIGMLYSAMRAHAEHIRVDPVGRELATDTRDLAPGALSVELNGPINMTLSRGTATSLTLRGEQRLLSKIVTERDGSVLRIDIRGMMFHHRQPIKLALVLPELQRLAVHGSGDCNVNGFSGDMLNVALNGSANVILNGRFQNINAAVHGSGELELNGGVSEKVNVELIGSGHVVVVGSAKTFGVKQTGSGELDAEHLSADNVTVNLRGSGNASVTATQSAELTLRGSGDIMVSGNPNRRSVNRSGSGDVTWNN